MDMGGMADFARKTLAGLIPYVVFRLERRGLRFHGRYYYRDGDPVPYCPPCLEARRTIVHLSLERDGYGGSTFRRCDNCKTVFSEKGPEPQQRNVVRSSWVWDW